MRPLCWFVIVFASFSLKNNGLGAAQTADVTGTWRGVYLAYPQVTRLDLDLSSKDGHSVDGVVTFQPVSTAGRSALGEFRGRFRVTGTFDSSVGAFVLVPGEWIERPARLARPLRMSGVLDRRSHQLAGTFDDDALSNPYFVLARANEAEGSILEPVEEALEKGGPERSVRLGRLKIPLNGGSADLNKVREWAERFASEFPTVDLQRTTMGQLTGKARNLFEDGHFSRYFGKTFDQMSPSDRQKVLKVMRERQNGRDAMGPYAFLSSAFSDPHGQFSPADVTIGVLAQRALRNWYNDALGRLQGLPAGARVLDELAAYKAARSSSIARLWPSELQTFDARVEQSGRRVALPALNAWADGIIHKASGKTGLAALTVAAQQLVVTASPARVAVRTRPLPPATGARSDRRAYASEEQPASRSEPDAWFEYVSMDDRAATQQRLRNKAESLLPTLMADERRQLQSLGTGAQALRAGVVWYSNFMSAYQPYQSTAPVREVLDAAQTRRRADLAAAAKELLAQVERAGTASEVGAIVSAHLGVPGDPQDPNGAKVERAATERGRVLGAAAAAAEKEANSATSVCKALPDNDREAGMNGDGPTSRDMCLAIAARFDAVNENLEAQARACKSFDSRNGNPFTAISCIALCGGTGGTCQMSVRLLSFKKIACGEAVGQAGWICDYQSQMTSRGTPPLPDFGPGLNKARFVKSPDGWLMITR
jgi:hypothetical protein